MTDNNFENNNVNDEVQELSMEDLDGVAGGMWVEEDERGMRYINGESEKFWYEWLLQYYNSHGFNEFMQFMVSKGFVSPMDVFHLSRELNGKSESEKYTAVMMKFNENINKACP